MPTNDKDAAKAAKGSQGAARPSPDLADRSKGRTAAEQGAAELRKLQSAYFSGIEGSNQPFKVEVIPATGAIISFNRTTPWEIIKVMDLN